MVRITCIVVNQPRRWVDPAMCTGPLRMNPSKPTQLHAIKSKICRIFSISLAILAASTVEGPKAMATTDTPIPDLIELSGLFENTTFMADGTGGGDILGVVDDATYTDNEASNSETDIAELNETGGGSGGTLTIGGVDYNITLANPTGPSGDVTYGTTGGSTGTITENGDDSDVTFITATPTGGGPTRYFALFDDNVGDIDGINSITTGTLDTTPAGNDVMINADEDNSISVVCFLEGTHIMTPDGPCPVQELRASDMVTTLDHGPQPIRWTHKRAITAAQLARNPILIPIRIEAGALGKGLPNETLYLSHQHRVLLRSKIAARMFGSSEVLVPAGKLLSMPGIARCTVKTPFSYHHFMCDAHEVILANGAPCETLMRGDQAFSALEGNAKTAWRLLQHSGRGPSRPVRARTSDIEKLVLRHTKNDKPLFKS